MKLSPLLVLVHLSPSAGRNLRSHTSKREVNQAPRRRIFSEKKHDRRSDDAGAEPDIYGEGFRKQTRIIGGGLADRDEYPYSVSLQGRGRHFCGGSLIAKDVVLSAAHCSGLSSSVVIGRHRLNSWFEGETISVKTEVPHPSYGSRNTDNDFNLIFLSREARAGELVSLNSDAAVPKSRETVTAMGWGDTVASESSSQLSNTLKEVNVKVVSNQDCRQARGFAGGYYTSYAGAITSNMLCAQAPGGDSCQGDSGGPLITKGSDGNQDVQVGVISWGMGCADSEFPGVYARVSSAYSWIRAEVCMRSSNPPASFECNYETSTTCGTEARRQADYRGTASVTASGRACQAWSSQAPHTHTRSEAAYPNGGLGDHNHCRNPDNNDRAWCYTLDPASRWEFCDVPDCASTTPRTSTAAATTPPAASQTGTVGKPPVYASNDFNGSEDYYYYYS